MIASIWGSKFWEGSGVEGTGIWSNGFARVFGGNREAARWGTTRPRLEEDEATKGWGPVHFLPTLWPFWLWLFFLIFSFIYYHKPRLEHLNPISILCVNNLILIEQKENTEYGREIGIH